jgi:hypothetical protein
MPKGILKHDFEFTIGQLWPNYKQLHGGLGIPRIFTGLGLTYDWRENSNTHVGISEFFVRDASTISNKEFISIQQFCQDPSKPD